MSGGTDPFSLLLYPMLREQPGAADEVVTGLARAPLEKVAESTRLRAELLVAQEEEILDCAAAIAARIGTGGRVLTCGNGGSATTAADLAAALMVPLRGERPVPALCLAADTSVVTAVANDVSFGDVFLRQIIALARGVDVVVAVSTSGGSENLVRAVVEARRRGLLTVALCGYDGGRLLAEGRPDHCFVVRSSSVHRIQEVQTAVCHLLVELVRHHWEKSACA